MDPSSSSSSQLFDNVQDIHKNLLQCNTGRFRQVYSSHQIIELEKEFRLTNYLPSDRRKVLSKELGLTERQIKIWFQNRRMKLKRTNPELVVEYVKESDRSQANETNSSIGFEEFVRDHLKNNVSKNNNEFAHNLSLGNKEIYGHSKSWKNNDSVTKERPKNNGTVDLINLAINKRDDYLNNGKTNEFVLSELLKNSTNQTVDFRKDYEKIQTFSRKHDKSFDYTKDTGKSIDFVKDYLENSQKLNLLTSSFDQRLDTRLLNKTMTPLLSSSNNVSFEDFIKDQLKGDKRMSEDVSTISNILDQRIKLGMEKISKPFDNEGNLIQEMLRKKLSLFAENRTGMSVEDKESGRRSELEEDVPTDLSRKLKQESDVENEEGEESEEKG